MEKSELLKTFSAIHTAGGVVSTVMFPESSCPEAMIRGEEKLVELDELNNEFIEHYFL